MANFKDLVNKFNNLPTAAKAAIAIGAGLGIYLLIGNRQQTQTQTSAEDEVMIYPYAMPNEDDDYGVGGGSSGDNGNLGFDTPESGMTAGDWDDVKGFMDDWGTTFVETYGLDKDVAVEASKPAGDSSPDYDLYRAQLDYGKATTNAQREAAAQAGEDARFAGATDSGANAIWQKNKPTGSGGGGSNNGSKNTGSNVASDGKIYSQGGSGKEFAYNGSNGNIMVNNNGNIKYVSPGDKNYNDTKKAMEADTGRKF